MRMRVGFSSTENRLPVSFGSEDVTVPVKFEGVVISGAQFWFGTREEYNAIPSPNPNICYCIEEGT